MISSSLFLFVFLAPVATIVSSLVNETPSYCSDVKDQVNENNALNKSNLSSSQKIFIEEDQRTFDKICNVNITTAGNN